MNPIIGLQDLKDKAQDDILKALNSSIDGLSPKEAATRLKIYGLNQVQAKPRKSALLKFLSYFKDPLIILLLFASGISALTGSTRAAIIISAMIFLSVILNFYQEHKSSKAAEKIASRLSILSRVKRDRQEQEVRLQQIVPGDIVMLSAGDIVPADGIILEADDFFLNESALTGESLPVEKSAAQNGNIVFSGTNVISGFGAFIAVKTGFNTEFGKIASSLNKPEELNAFEKGIKKFGFLIIRTIAIIVAIIFLLNAILKKDLLDSLIFSLAVAVGVTPELLPMIMSVAMSRGAIKMSKKGVLIKKLSAIPDFGSMDILCTDKTGTLTQDKITVIKHLDVSGQENEEVFKLAYLNGYFETGIKSLLDRAILDYKTIDVSSYKKIEEIPYDFSRKRSSIVCRDESGIRMITKGAPEEVFKICASYYENGQVHHLNEQKLIDIKKIYDDLSNDGLRVLAVTEKILPVAEKYSVQAEDKLILRGFIAFYDPPKLSAKETLVFMKEHGVEIKILTGDGPLVTKKICSEIGLEVNNIISGDELDLNKISDLELYNKTRHATICARLSPAQKERIIIQLRAHGLTVGYLGDGINDAPSLKSADVGISVENAVDVAKETADIILMTKGLQELMEGVIEGRKTFGNTMKYLMMGLSSNFGNMFSMIGATIFLPFFPMTAGQILLNNFLYDTSQLSIPSDKVDNEYLRKPKHWNMRFIKRYMLVFGPISSAFDFATFYLLYKVFSLSGGAFQAGWFIESLATQIFVIYIIRTKKIPFIQSRPSWPLLITTASAVALGLIIITTKINSFFSFSSLSLKMLSAIGLIVIGYLIIAEITKHFFYKFSKESIQTINKQTDR